MVTVWRGQRKPGGHIVPDVVHGVDSAIMGLCRRQTGAIMWSCKRTCWEAL